MDIPFYDDLNTTLLTIGGEPWRIRDAVEATAVWGAPGSGKSSGSGRALATAFLTAGMGGVVLCAKTDECSTWIKYAEQTGRSDDLIIVDANTAQRFNILEWAVKNIATAGFEGNLIDLMNRMAEAARLAEGRGGSDGEGKYFVDNAMKWARNAFPMLTLAYDTVRLKDLRNFISSGPQSANDKSDFSVYNNLPADEVPFFVQTMILADARRESLKAQADQARATDAPEAAALREAHLHAERLISEHAEFFFDEFARLDHRPRTSIESTLTALIDPFLSGKLSDLFCTTSTFTPDDCREGKIILFDLPTLRYGTGGTVAQTLFKYLFGLAAQRRPIGAHERPIFIFADEAQFYLGSSDADMLSTARASRICIVFLTQDLPTYYAKLGTGARDIAESILSKFGTRIFHANSSRETNLYASELIGRTRQYNVNQSTSSGFSSGRGGGTHDEGAGHTHGNSNRNTGYSQTTNAYMDYEIQPDFFARELRTGGDLHHYKVDGIVFRNGKKWKRTGRQWINAEFTQR